MLDALASPVGYLLAYIHTGLSTFLISSSGPAWALSIVLLTVTVRLLLFPLFVKQIRSQRAMQAIQPKVKELQAKHKGDKETMQRELMELYRKEKANPLMGCLPLLLQMPVFLGLFHVLKRITPDNQAKTLYSWTVEQFDSAAQAKLFGAPLSGKFGSSTEEILHLGGNVLNVKIVAGLLVLTMMITTYLTSRQMILKTGWSEDPQQKMIQRLMLYGIPITLLVSGYLFPIGVVIYWVITNLFSLGQQFWVLKKFPPPPTSGKSTAGKSTSGKAGKNGSAVTTPAVVTVDAPKPGVRPVNPKRRGSRR